MDYTIVFVGIAVLILVPVCIPWWINHCDKIGVEKARQRTGLPGPA
jgi:hypothetical protein